MDCGRLISEKRELDCSLVPPFSWVIIVRVSREDGKSRSNELFNRLDCKVLLNMRNRSCADIRGGFTVGDLLLICKMVELKE